MPNLLTEPQMNYRPKCRTVRGKQFIRAKRRPSREPEYPTRSVGFVAEIQLSTSSGKMRTPSERSVYDILIGLGLDPVDEKVTPVIEPYALKIIRNGDANDQIGWFVPDFYVLGEEGDNGRLGTYIEVSMGDDLSKKLHKIRFVAEKYGKLVIFITRDNIQSFINDPESLLELIMKTRVEEFDLEDLRDKALTAIDIVSVHRRLGTVLEPRIKLGKARKPSKGKRRAAPSTRKKRERPSRDPERRAKRRAQRRSTRELQRLAEKTTVLGSSLFSQNRKMRSQSSPVTKSKRAKIAPAKAPSRPKSKQYRQMVERKNSVISKAA